MRKLAEQNKKKELLRIQAAAKLGKDLGLNIHAGHGLTVDNLKAILKISQIFRVEYWFFNRKSRIVCGI
jgi:pyridoxine 5-phosphate synthase